MMILLSVCLPLSEYVGCVVSPSQIQPCFIRPPKAHHSKAMRHHTYRNLRSEHRNIGIGTEPVASRCLNMLEAPPFVIYDMLPVLLPDKLQYIQADIHGASDEKPVPVFVYSTSTRIVHECYY